MSFRRLNILTLAAAVLVTGTVALADDADGSGLTSSVPPAGSIASQLRLKMKLRRITSGGSLVTTLKHNRQAWESLTADERGSFRRDFMAYWRKTVAEREQILSHYEKLVKMTAERREAYRRRAKWLAIVVESFTPAERTELQAMTPDDRARKILARKALLITQGKLKLDGATTAPASAPAAKP